MHRTLIGTAGHVARYDLRDFKGRIFFVTDLHGHYFLLHEELRRVAFDSRTDLLFSGGDWADRHIDSKYVLDYVNEPWVHSVRGNHEQLFIDGFNSHWHPNHPSVICLKDHGGDWIWTLTDLEKILIADAFGAMPLGMELLLPNDRKVGIVHAEVPYNDWNKFVASTAAEIEWNDAATCQWARTWYKRQHLGEVKGVDLVLVGHTPTDTGKIERLGNMVFCDGGAPWNKAINLFEINEDFIGRMTSVTNEQTENPGKARVSRSKRL